MSSRERTTRTKILDAAVRLLEEKGGQGVRMGDIAKAANISRQAVYLHFDSRTQLLAAATRHLDQRLDLDRRLAPSRGAASGVARLEAYIAFWGEYVPEIHAASRALLAALHTDEAAAEAWRDRMLAMRDGCHAAIEALAADGVMAAPWNAEQATDLLWTMLSVPNWEQLTTTCGWTTDQYIHRMQQAARRIFVDVGRK